MELFDFIEIKYMIAVVLLSYVLIKLVDSFDNNPLPKWTKRTVTFVCGIFIGILYYYNGWITFENLIPNYLISNAAYDYIIKVILSKFKNFDYIRK